MIGQTRRPLALAAALAGAALAALGTTVASSRGAAAVADLPVSNLNTPAGHLTALRGSAAYRASGFPLALEVRPPDATWGGTQWTTSSFGKPAFGWIAFGKGGVTATVLPRGIVEIVTAYGSTPSAADVLHNLTSKGGGAMNVSKPARTTVAGYAGWRIDGEVWGKFGQALVPFSALTHGASPADFYRLGKGESFRIDVLDVHGKRVVIYIESVKLPAGEFASFRASAEKLLATMRFET